MKSLLISCCAITTLFASCKNEEDGVMAYGNFETTEVIVAAEATGKLLSFKLEEGDSIAANAVVGAIDSTQLYLKRSQLQASVKAVRSKKPPVNPQLEVIHQQILAQQKEQQRIKKMYDANAATAKQLDDINAAVAVLEKQYASMAATLSTQVEGVEEETKPLEAQIAQVEDQLNQSLVVNPVAGTVLVKYVEQGEVVNYGKALYKIGDLNNMILRVYVSARQLPSIKIGQTVKVRIDGTEGGTFVEYPGKITWVASEAEFTPKVIQTLEERTQLVYAVKIAVKNDGKIKLGMPGELML
ncbi:hypothetical protein COR50_20340 [Chitinophaga caeni]|uniref:HlyD family secretion protein n=1 Tax=Chitinophaga caeni TaxID=2029983 RepID=A0A291QZH9_9BACT|nr:HlyD family efflux transporter periplasmic adaptor subunit [Chitinophaga caeni]ATL49335.1 hypothetical protein COR50_20340 [Chitinophaga caeni]